MARGGAMMQGRGEMSEMVERVARAIFKWEYRDHRRPRPEVHPPWSIYVGAARAAIEAMAETTSKMRLAANDIEIERVGDRVDEKVFYFVTGYEADDIWRAMITAALESQENRGK